MNHQTRNLNHRSPHIFISMFRTRFHPTLGKDITCLNLGRRADCGVFRYVAGVGRVASVFARTSTDQAGRGVGFFDVITISSSQANDKLQGEGHICISLSAGRCSATGTKTSAEYTRGLCMKQRPKTLELASRHNRRTPSINNDAHIHASHSQGR
jgi:hypothetical protein